jgi:hypothetical protein
VVLALAAIIAVGWIQATAPETPRADEGLPSKD